MYIEWQDIRLNVLTDVWRYDYITIVFVRKPYRCFQCSFICSEGFRIDNARLILFFKVILVDIVNEFCGCVCLFCCRFTDMHDGQLLRDELMTCVRTMLLAALLPEPSSYWHVFDIWLNITCVKTWHECTTREKNICKHFFQLFTCDQQ